MEKEIAITLLFVFTVGPLFLYMLYKIAKISKEIA
jgi:hypothetical protein